MDIKRYASFHRILLENSKREQEEIIDRARNSLQDIVSVLRNKPTVTKAVIFGSLVNGTFTKGSDIDIAVEGIPPGDFFSIWREIEEKIGLEIDLIDLDPDNIPIYNVIRRTGKVIYEKS